MVMHLFSPDEEPFGDYDPANSKEERTHDAEIIRQEFIRSQRLPTNPPQRRKPLPKKTEDEY
jgi:hypothetical protein